MVFNAQSFKEALISGYNNLYNYYPEIDKLNVFPVPDGDTGTNMNLTMTNAVKEISDLNSSSIGKIADVFARGLIMGARGNSGVILSQIFRGLANGLKGVNTLNTESFKNALVSAKEVAYKAVMKPVEGTILTVIRETSEQAWSIDNNVDFVEFIDKVVEYANRSLNNTPSLLPILKEVGVVDSGGYGLVKVFEGMSAYFKTGKVVEKRKKQIDTGKKKIKLENQEEEYGYCTEGIIILNKEYVNNINVDRIRKTLEDQGGKSIVTVIDQDILKVHVHVLVPGTVLTFLQQYGEFKNVKIDNMTLQAENHVKALTSERELKNNDAIIAVVPSVEIGKYFAEELNVQGIIDGGLSMNPSTDDYLRAIKEVDAKEVFIFPNNSNAILAAQQAAKMEKLSKVYVIPTISVQEGMVASLAYDPSEVTKKKIALFKSAVKNVLSVSISQASKSAVLEGVKVLEGEYIGIIDKKIICSNPDLQLVIKQLFDKTISKSSEIITIFVGEMALKPDIEFLKKYLDENFDVEYEIVKGNQRVYPYLIAIE